MNLTEYFNTLDDVDKPYNKYATYSLAFNNPYRIATGYHAFTYDRFDRSLRQFITSQGKCIVMPNIVNGDVVALLFRSLSEKRFHYYNECPYIPYGAGVNNKPYYKPWVIVESALDSDFIRNFYPYVISTNTASVSKANMSFLMGTCSTVYCAFDNDKAGDESFRNMCMRYSGKDNCFHIKRMKPPMDLYGNYLKDFGDIIECLHKRNMDDYEYYLLTLRNYFIDL